MLELTTPDDPWAMQMLEKYLPPKDVHWTFDKQQAVEYVVECWRAAMEFWLVDKEREFFFRCVVHNPVVILPHIMGDGRFIRGCGREAMAWVKERGIEQVVVWTQHPNIGRIMLNLGFTEVARIPRMYYDDGKQAEVFAYCKDLT